MPRGQRSPRKGRPLTRRVLTLTLALLALPVGAAAHGAGPSGLERHLPAEVGGVALAHHDRLEATRPRTCDPGETSLFTGCRLADVQIATTRRRPQTAGPHVQVKIMRLARPAGWARVRRELAPLGTAPGRLQQVGGRAVLTLERPGTAYAATQITPRVVALAVADRHATPAATRGRAQAAIAQVLERVERPDPPRQRIPVPARSARRSADRLSHDRCVPGSTCPTDGRLTYRVVLDVAPFDEIPAPTCSADRVISTHCYESPNYCKGRADRLGRVGATFTSSLLPEGVAFFGYIKCYLGADVAPLTYSPLLVDCDTTRRLRFTLRGSGVQFTDVPRGTGYISDSRYLRESGMSYYDSDSDKDVIEFHNWDIKTHGVAPFTACANP